MAGRQVVSDSPRLKDVTLDVIVGVVFDMEDGARLTRLCTVLIEALGSGTREARYGRSCPVALRPSPPRHPRVAWRRDPTAAWVSSFRRRLAAFWPAGWIRTEAPYSFHPTLTRARGCCVALRWLRSPEVGVLGAPHLAARGGGRSWALLTSSTGSGCSDR